MKKNLSLFFFIFTITCNAINPISDFYQKNKITTKSILIALSPNDCNNCMTPLDELLNKILTINSEIQIYIITSEELSEIEKILFKNKFGIGLINIQVVAHKTAYNYLFSKKDGTPSICYVSETSKILYLKNLKDDDLEKLFKLISSQTHNQSFYSEYIAINSSFKTLKKINNNNEPAETIPLMLAAFTMGITATHRIYIHSNCNYAYIKILLEEVNKPGIPLGEESAEIYLLDYNKHIFYDLKKFTYSIYKDPESYVPPANNTKDSIYSTYIISKSNPNDSALITFNKSLPKCLTNKVILLNNQDGIQELQTKNHYIKLMLFKSNSGFDIEKKYRFAKTKCTEETNSRNYLFLN